MRTVLRFGARAAPARAIAFLVFLFAFPGGSDATPDDEQALKQMEADIRELRNLARLQTQKAVTVQGEVHRLDLETTLAREELKLSSSEAAAADANLREMEDKTRGLERSIGDSRDEIDRIVRRLYQTRVPGTLRLLLASGNPAELTATQGYLSYFARLDLRRIENHQKLLKELSDVKTHRAAEVDRLTRSRAAVASKAAVLEAKSSERKAFLGRLMADRQTYARNLGDLEEAANRLRAMLDHMQKEPAGAPPPEGIHGAPFPSLKGALPWPHPGAVAAGFGKRVNERFKTVTFNSGIDIRGELGDEVRAVHTGLVRFSDWFEGNGRMVIIEHGDRFMTIYAHLSELLVGAGTYVRRGQVIGRLGDTGSLEGPVLHFEIRKQAQPVDPIEWLQRRRRSK